MSGINNTMAALLDRSTPKFNPQITRGFAKEVLETAIDAFLPNILQGGMRALRPNIPLTFNGIKKISPVEDFNTIFKKNESVKLSLNNSDIYPVYLLFEYDGSPIHLKIYLPYCRTGNIMKIDGTIYRIVPVLTDTVISPSDIGVFIRLLMGKNMVYGPAKNIVINGIKTHLQILQTSTVSVKAGIANNLGKVNTPLSLYLLSVYGLAGTLHRYYHIDRNNFLVSDVYPENKDDYNIYESCGSKPKELTRVDYSAHSIKICISTSVPRTAGLDNFIAGLIYTLDVLPDAELELYKILDKGDMECTYWRILFGRIVYRDAYTLERIIPDTNEHFQALNSYMDAYNASKLASNGMLCENFFDLLAILLEQFSMLHLKNKEYAGNIKNRYLDILYYILYDIIIGFNRAIMSINRKYKNKLPANKEDVRTLLAKELKPMKIEEIAKSSNPNICVGTVDYVGDCYPLKITRSVEEQNRAGAGVRRGPKMSFPLLLQQLGGKDGYFGSLYDLSKNTPSAMLKLNPYLDINIHTGKINLTDEESKIISILDLALSNIGAELNDDDDGESIKIEDDLEAGELTDEIDTTDDTESPEENDEID